MPSDLYNDIRSLVEAEERDPRRITADLLRIALETGIRRELRETVAHALDQATGDAPKELTDLACRRLKPGNRISDPQYAGLILVASKRGKRWLCRSQAGGSQRQVTLGHYPTLTLAEAREKWATVRAEGLDSRAADTRSQTTLDALVDEFIDHQKASGVRSADANLKSLTANLLSRHAGMTVGEVTADMLDDLFVPLISTKPGAARNIRAPISALFGWAERNKKLPAGMQGPKMVPVPAPGKKEFRPRSAHIRALLRGLEGDRWGDLIRFQLLTGVRITEAHGADWSEIDLAERRWTIPAARMKGKAEHVVMLSDQAIDILARQTQREGRVFLALSLPMLHRDWATRRDALGLPVEYTSHTHRAAMLSWVAEKKGGRDIRDRLSAHKPPGSADDNYQLSELNGPAAEWWQRWADHIDVVEAENVLQIGEARA